VDKWSYASRGQKKELTQLEGSSRAARAELAALIRMNGAVSLVKQENSY